MDKNLMVFEKWESKVRSYCRAFPTVLVKADGSYVEDECGRRYIDFLCGAGAVNYGHNNPVIKDAVIEYMQGNGITMGLDFHTNAKRDFVEIFNDLILSPRNLHYRMQFTSPTGTSVVESAIKLARKFTGRENIVAFTNGFHGMTGVSLSVSGSRHHRQAVSYSNVTRFPYDNYVGKGFEEISYYRKMLLDNSSGVDLPAAFILETVQGEGGVNIASENWLRSLSHLAKEVGALMIVDDVQAGCGRTGNFFSFERADIQPDMVCLSKSIGGFGIPMSLLLLKDELDIWSPGEDNGTFRGNNIAFVSAKKMIDTYWNGFDFEKTIEKRAEIIKEYFLCLGNEYPDLIKEHRGIGLMYGLEFYSEDVCAKISKLCFKNGLIIESSGERDQVLKLLPPLTISLGTLKKGLEIIGASIGEHLQSTAQHEYEKVQELDGTFSL